MESIVVAINMITKDNLLAPELLLDTIIHPCFALYFGNVANDKVRFERERERERARERSRR